MTRRQIIRQKIADNNYPVALNSPLRQDIAFDDIGMSEICLNKDNDDDKGEEKMEVSTANMIDTEREKSLLTCNFNHRNVLIPVHLCRMAADYIYKSHPDSPSSEIKLFAVFLGLICIRSKSSQLEFYLAVYHAWRLQGLLTAHLSPHDIVLYSFYLANRYFYNKDLTTFDQSQFFQLHNLNDRITTDSLLVLEAEVKGLAIHKDYLKVSASDLEYFVGKVWFDDAPAIVPNSTFPYWTA